jgi:hypothetical protein
MFKNMAINDCRRPAPGSNGNARWFFMKPESSPFETTSDPNPVKTTRDQLGNVTKMEYQAQPSGAISPSVEGDSD